jgi:hypothetical protein
MDALIVHIATRLSRTAPSFTNDMASFLLLLCVLAEDKSKRQLRVGEEVAVGLLSLPIQPWSTMTSATCISRRYLPPLVHCLPTTCGGRLHLFLLSSLTLCSIISYHISIQPEQILQNPNKLLLTNLCMPLSINNHPTMSDREALSSRSIPFMELSDGSAASLTVPPPPLPHYLNAEGRAMARFTVEGNAVSKFSCTSKKTTNSLAMSLIILQLRIIKKELRSRQSQEEPAHLASQPLAHSSNTVFQASISLTCQPHYQLRHLQSPLYNLISPLQPSTSYLSTSPTHSPSTRPFPPPLPPWVRWISSFVSRV